MDAVFDCSLGRELTPEEVAAMQAPSLSLAERQAAAKAQVKAEQSARFAAGWTHEFSVGTHTLDLRDADDKANWTLLLIKTQGMVGAGYGAAPITIRTAADETISIPASEANAAMAVFLEWGEALLSAKWDFDEAIDAASDAEDLDAIDLEAGWP